MTASLSTFSADQLGASVGWWGRTAFVTVEGAVDFYTVRQIKRLLLELLEREPSQLLIDVRNAFVDSSGIGVFVHVAQRAQQERRHFRLICHERLAELLRMHGLDDVLGMSATASAAELPDQRHPLAA
jgi:anti-anti-sigma factor